MQTFLLAGGCQKSTQIRRFTEVPKWLKYRGKRLPLVMEDDETLEVSSSSRQAITSCPSAPSQSAQRILFGSVAPFHKRANHMYLVCA
jgi:hypothetical protein